MNSKYFIIGRRYWSNRGDSTYYAISERYTRSGYRYIRFKNDLTGDSYEYRVNIKDGEECVDLFGGAVKGAKIDDDCIMRASMQTDYIAVSNKEGAFLDGEETELSLEELKRYIEKLPLGTNATFKIKKLG